MLYLAKLGFLRKYWLCWCENTSKNDGFYPCDEDGNYHRDIWGKSKYYTCTRCGRIVEVSDEAVVVGLTKGFKLKTWEIYCHLISLRAAGRESLGVSEATLERRLTPRFRRLLTTFRPKV